MEDVFPVLPFRSALYSPDELFSGFSLTDPRSYASTPDFRAYRSTRREPNREVGMLRALHDQSVTEQRTDLLQGHRVVAIMGGHAMARDQPAYRAVAELARSLARAGFTVVSGGGPGAMEASHLGALLARSGDHALDFALDELATVPAFPDTNDLVRIGGDIDHDRLEALHRWQVPAFTVLAEVDPAGRGLSLAVPTWFYGHEPPTPFASHLAKYFSNPLREDGLLAIALDGVVYAPGWAGTVQEVFQDATQNVYRVVGGTFSPMAFFNLDQWWTERLPVLPLLRELYGEEQFAAKVLVAAEPDQILSFLGG